MGALLLAAAMATFGVGARVERSMRVAVERGKVRAPPEARLEVARRAKRIIVTVQR